MIRKIALAAILLVLSGRAANAVVVCSISATGVVFEEVAKSGQSAFGAIVISCVGTGNADYVITLSTGFAGQYSPRAMTNIANHLPYNLYSETSLSSIWGNGAGGSTVVRGTITMGNNLTTIVSLPVYGRTEFLAEPAPGNYLDVINAVMLYTGGTTTTQFPVRASVPARCTVSATNLNFGDYTQAQLDGQSQIQLTCSDTIRWDVGLDGGRYPGATIGRRSMSGPQLSQLNYQLFTDPARTAVWGNNVGNDTVFGTGSGLPQTLNVYGRIPSGQSVRPGGYVDTIVATVTF